MLEHEKKMIYPIIIGTAGLIALRALVNGLSAQGSNSQKSRSLPDFDVSKVEVGRKNLSPKALIEYKYQTKSGYDIYSYSTDFSTDEINQIYCPELLASNDLESLVFSRTAPYLGLASDLKTDPPQWAMAGPITPIEVAVRNKKQNKALIAKCLKRKENNVSLFRDSEKKLLMGLLATVEASLMLYNTECSFDVKRQKTSGNVSILDTQRALAAALWTVIQNTTSRPYMNFADCILEFVVDLIENNKKVAEVQRNASKYRDFVEYFEAGWFNCETPGANKLYVISNPSMVLLRNMIPSRSKSIGGVPVAFPPEFEPIFIAGAVFYADTF